MKLIRRYLAWRAHQNRIVNAFRDLAEADRATRAAYANLAANVRAGAR